MIHTKENSIALFKSAKCCVLIPTYNNSRTLKGVIEGVQSYTDDIIVVNDGSTDNTSEILNSFHGVQKVEYVKNRGKGIALRRGFEYAHQKGYKYAITIDSDGQHDPIDLPLFLDKLNEDGNAIIIGARNMNQASVPGKSSFGHKFSNFWFKFETGIDAPDTQSGYRLYPLEPLSKMRFFSWKYEFEIEVIVRASWKGINILSVPVTVYYPEDRITHFRPFKDFSRVSVLNTVLVTLALLYHIPVRYYKSLKKKSFREFIKENIIDGDESNLKKSTSIGFGIFMGVIPIWGYQIITGIALSHLLRLNKYLVVLFSNISIPPCLPFIIFFSYKTGGWLLGAPDPDLSQAMTWEFVKQNLFQYILGSTCVAIGGGILVGIVSYIALSVFRRKSAKMI